MTIWLRNVRSTAPGATSIAIRDAKQEGALALLAPTWDMVSGLKAYSGVEKFKDFKPVISYEEYIEKYRKLLLKDRYRDVRAWVASLTNETHIELYCYCKPMPAGFPALAEPTDDLCTRWFCHRWLVYKLLTSWRPLLNVEIS